MIVKYLIERPIAVTAIFISILAISIYGWFQIPVNLLPDVDPPELSIEVRSVGSSAEALENAVLNPIRQSVIGAYGLKNIESTSSQGVGRVVLAYEFGTDMDLAMVEANEKIDRILSSLPPDLERPLIRKKKPSDIPVVRIHLASNIYSITALSQIVIFDISKRFEQVAGVAQIESSGKVQKSIQLHPKMDRVLAAGLDLTQLGSIIQRSNFPIGQVMVKNGLYEYQIQIENLIKDEQSLRSLKVRTTNGQLAELSDFFEISQGYLNPSNHHVFNGQRGIVLAIYGQPNANLIQLKKDLEITLNQLESDLKQISFTSSQDQVMLLKDNINQLYITSGLAAFFAFLVFFISSKSRRLPFLLGLVIPSAILISIGVLWVSGLTLNIITLSGFVLGIGLLVDNVIILIEEINQNRNAGLNIKEACIVSAKNIFPALLSSTFTTICVFIPLIAVEGVASALFLEQAIALIIILLVSLLVTFVLIPTYYLRWIHREILDYQWIEKLKKFFHSSSNKYASFIGIPLLLIAGFMCVQLTEREDLPTYSTSDFQFTVLWNEPISLKENESRMLDLVKDLNADFVSADLGITEVTQNELKFFDQLNLYVKTSSVNEKRKAEKILKEKMESGFRKASFQSGPAVNPVEMIFYDNKPPVEIRFRKDDGGLFHGQDLISMIGETNGHLAVDFKSSLAFSLNNERITLASLQVDQVVNHLRNLSDERTITSLKNPDQAIPITINYSGDDYFIKNDSVYYGLSDFYEVKDTLGLRTITSDLSGPYVSYVSNDKEAALKAGQQISKEQDWLFDVKGSLLQRDANLKNLAWSGLLGLILLYLVLVAQFESFLQPMAIFLMIPLSIAGSFIGLYLLGATLNIMTIIGLIVMLGIIVNDSILKIDAINRNIKSGLSKVEAILKAKDERLKPILMTSLSTVLALTPVLFSSGIASDLQKPLAIAVIGGLVVGTWASVVILPRVYSLLK